MGRDFSLILTLLKINILALILSYPFGVRGGTHRVRDKGKGV